MATVRDVPNMTGQKIAIGAEHCCALERPFHEGFNHCAPFKTLTEQGQFKVQKFKDGFGRKTSTLQECSKGENGSNQTRGADPAPRV